MDYRPGHQRRRRQRLGQLVFSCMISRNNGWVLDSACPDWSSGLGVFDPSPGQRLSNFAFCGLSS